MKKSKFIQLLIFKTWLYYHHLKPIAKILDFLVRIIFSCDIPSSVKLDEYGQLPHFGLGVVIHPRTIIGKNFRIYQNVTIGFRKAMGPPTLGDNCFIGSGACILGNVKIGDNCTIGANAVVLCDVPDNCVAVGVPAIIKKRVLDISQENYCK